MGIVIMSMLLLGYDQLLFCDNFVVSWRVRQLQIYWLVFLLSTWFILALYHCLLLLLLLHQNKKNK